MTSERTGFAMTLRLTNTLSRQLEDFVPADPQRVTLYVCGPTVYNFAHIGNARPAVVFDVLYRILQQQFPRVIYARNFTDVDDKINAAARGLGQPIEVITERYIAAYREDMTALGILTPNIEPRVTDHIDDIIGMIERLIASGNAYVAEQHVLFSVRSFPAYGDLSRRDPEEMLAGARVEVAPFKKDPGDFVLWKPSGADLPGWASPWGRGRPGWHIECSAMIEHHLGSSIDIHGGGQDLIFPHHENEIAQGTCAHRGELYCRYWLHNGFVTVEGRKMSKSLGNVLLVRDLLTQAPGEAIRFALLNAQYRQPLDWSAAGLLQAKRGLDRLYGVLREFLHLPSVHPEKIQIDAFVQALHDDLNFPAAIAELFNMAKAVRQASGAEQQAQLRDGLRAAGAMLGLLQQEPAAWFGVAADVQENADLTQIQDLVQRRQAARAARDFAAADRIRAELTALGIIIEDRADGPIWRRSS
jgi:cysteinyl-tRNA synthetase